jgi:superfamily II DNA/RNA helicase
VRHVVIDEADTMLEADFKNELNPILTPIRKRLEFYANSPVTSPGEGDKPQSPDFEKLFHRTQFVFVCATLTQQLQKV